MASKLPQAGARAAVAALGLRARWRLARQAVDSIAQCSGEVRGPRDMPQPLAVITLKKIHTIAPFLRFEEG